MEKEIKVTFSAEDKNFSSTFSGASAQVGKMYSDMAKFAKQYATSSKESLQYVEEQIRNQQKIYQSTYKKDLAFERELFTTGKISPKEYQSDVADINKRYQFEKTLIDQLRELISDDKAANFQTIAEEKKRTQEQKISDKQKQLEAKNEKERDREKEDKGSGRGDARVVDIVRIMQQVAQSQNSYQAVVNSVPGVTSLITGNPIANAIAGLVSGVASRALEAGGTYQRSLANLSQITGKGYAGYAPETMFDKNNDVLDRIESDVRIRQRSVWANRTNYSGSYIGNEGGDFSWDKLDKGYSKSQYDKDSDILNSIQRARQRQRVVQSLGSTEIEQANAMGYAASDFVNLRAKASRATGSFAGSNLEAMDIIALMKGRGIDESTALTLSKQGRSSGLGAYESTNYMFGNLKNRGLMTSGDTSLLPEYLQQLVEINQKQLETLGDINVDQNAGKLGAIASLGKDFTNPELIKAVMPKLESTFGESQNAGFKALQYMTMSQMGETNVFNMKKMMENPLANREYITNMIDKLKSVSGGNDQMASWYLSQMSGGSINQTMAEKLMAGDWSKFKKGVGGFEDLNAYSTAQEGYGTTSLEVSSADWKTKFEEIGNRLITDMNVVADLFKKSKEDAKSALKDAGVKSDIFNKDLDKLEIKVKNMSKK